MVFRGELGPEDAFRLLRLGRLLGRKSAVSSFLALELELEPEDFAGGLDGDFDLVGIVNSSSGKLTLDFLKMFVKAMVVGRKF